MGYAIIVFLIAVLLIIPKQAAPMKPDIQVKPDEKKNRPQRNNNPGNLMYAGQAGAIGQDEAGFAIFETVEAGWRALERQIELDANRGHTLRTFITKYAPPEHNPTENYILFLKKELAIEKDSTPVKAINVGSLSKSMAKYEGFYV